MTPASRLACCVVALLAGARAPVLARAAAQRAIEMPAGITVRADVDRPAIWIADRLTYTIEIACPRGIDIVVDDLARDKLKLTGLEIVAADTVRRVDGGDVTRYAFHYVLTTYRVDVPTPALAPLTVRYYIARAGEGPETAAPAGSFVVPGASVAFRSLLPDDQVAYAVRDARSVEPPSLRYRLLEPLGIGLMLVSLAPVAFLAARLTTLARERRRSRVRVSSRQTRRTTRAALDELGAVEPDTLEARREAFARLDGVVRQHVADVCGVAAAGLTPEEITLAIEPCAARIPRELVTSVLTSCELARYATPELQPSPAAWQDALAQARQLLSAGR
jgi:hypothetical protein